MNFSSQHIINPSTEQRANAARMMVCGPMHANGMLWDQSSQGSVSAGLGSASYRLKYQSALGRHLLHVHVSVRRGPNNG